MAQSGRALMVLLLVLAGAMVGCSRDGGSREPIFGTAEAPVARKIPRTLVEHDRERIDEYAWMREMDPEDPSINQLLLAENVYTRKILAPARALQQALYDEMASYLSPDDQSVKVKVGKYRYFREFQAGKERPVYFREAVEKNSEVEVLLDENVLARSYDYYELINWAVSPSDHLIAYAEDKQGSQSYALKVRDLASGSPIGPILFATSGDLAWANDSEQLFYVRINTLNGRPDSVYLHRLSESADEDQLIYQEPDPHYQLHIYRSKDDRYIVISSIGNNSTEIRLANASHPQAPLQLVAARQSGVQYSVRSSPSGVYIRTNWHAENFRLMRVDHDNLGDHDRWQEIVPGGATVFLDDVEVFADYLVLAQHQRGLGSLKIYDRQTGSIQEVLFGDAVYQVSLFSNPDYESQTLMYTYSSLNIPTRVMSYDMGSGVRTILKQDKLPKSFLESNYATKRLVAESRDGVLIPISIVYRKDQRKSGGNPLLVHGYGAYGHSLDVGFNSSRLPLLDRGFIIALAHVRGGRELGNDWYLDGKLMNKRNSFNDFIDATLYLIDAGYAKKNKVFASGNSAGGLMMGVIANEAPQLYQGIVTHVPFVDLLSTLMDESLPLTMSERDEWGDPTDPDQYEYMVSYSPFDQVKQQDYPNMFVTTAIRDIRVGFVEPLKWVSRLRDRKRNDSLLLLDIDMNSGHSGPSWHYDRYWRKAMEYTFLIGLAEQD